MMTDAEYAALARARGIAYADLVRHNERRREAAAERVRRSWSPRPDWVDDERDAKRQTDL